MSSTMAYTTPKLEVHFGPSAMGAPDDLLPPIRAIVEGARDELLVMSQQLEHRGFTDALIRAKRRGVDVSVVLERNYLRERKPAANPWRPSGDNEMNRTVLVALMRARIPVRIERKSRLMHINAIVADAKTDRASVVLSSANFTVSGFHRHLNHVVICRDGTVAAAFAREFGAAFTDASSSPHASAPVEVELDGLRVRVVFGPEHAPEMEVMKQLLKARERVDFSVFTFSGTSGVDDALSATRARGIEIRGLIDGRQGWQRWSAAPTLVAAGVDVRMTDTMANFRKLHHKVLVVDGKVTAIGTGNFTRPAARLNEEALLVIGQTDDDAGAELGAFINAEIARLHADQERPIFDVSGA